VSFGLAGSATTLRPRVGTAAAFLLILLATVPPQARAQQTLPARPRLSAGADTNSAAGYYFHGLERLRADRADEAADAFFWASRLAPDWADPLAALRVALLVSGPHRLVALVEGDRSVVGSPDGRRIDSLRLRALQLDPFVYEDLERLIVMRYVTELVVADLRREYGVSEAESRRRSVENDVRLYLRRPQAAAWRAWVAYAERRLDDAVKLYAEALKRAAGNAHAYRGQLHAQRARAFYLVGRQDSSAVELVKAIGELERRDQETLVRVYESKALLEFSLGLVLEKLGDLDGARAAYGRALVEDLAFHPAHLRLGGLRAAEGDTAGALAEFELAVEVAPDDPVARLILANHFHANGDNAAALATLEPLTEREPYWAEVHLLRALALDRLGSHEGAAAAYARFLASCEVQDDRREAVTRRLAVLEGRQP
jgi:tetratricopeptide (TPR) repeat protein